MAALLAGQSVSEVAKAYNIPRGTVGRWSSECERPIETNRNTKKEIGGLILDYLRQVLATLTAQQQVFGDESWLRKQPASELAVLHGVSADKAFRLLEAFKSEPETEDDAVP